MTSRSHTIRVRVNDDEKARIESRAKRGGLTVSEYLRTAGLPRNGRAARKHRGEECEDCGATENLDAHHLDGDHTNNDPANVETLCRACHRRRHNPTASEQMRQLNFRADDELIVAATSAAESQGVTLSEFVREAIRAKLGVDVGDGPRVEGPGGRGEDPSSASPKPGSKER